MNSKDKAVLVKAIQFSDHYKMRILVDSRRKPDRLHLEEENWLLKG